MIHGYINFEGELKLESSNPTERYALRKWFEDFKKFELANREGSIIINADPVAGTGE